MAEMCRYGHPLVGDNLCPNPRATRCRTCQRNDSSAYRNRARGDQQLQLTRFLEQRSKHTDTSDPQACWTWGGPLNYQGYGQSYLGRGAHWYAYMVEHGQVPEGLHLDHLCRNRACVNPEHLEPVTVQENILRGTSPSAANAVKSSCPRNHPYDEANTYVDPTGRRHCRTCKRSRSHA